MFLIEGYVLDSCEYTRLERKCVTIIPSGAPSFHIYLFICFTLRGTGRLLRFSYSFSIVTGQQKLNTVVFSKHFQRLEN